MPMVRKLDRGEGLVLTDRETGEQVASIRVEHDEKRLTKVVVVADDSVAIGHVGKTKTL